MDLCLCRSSRLSQIRIQNAFFERNTFFIFSPLSRERGRGDNYHIFLCLMVLARHTIMMTKYNMLERFCQYQDHLRCLCPFLLPIFTHCISLNYFNFSLPTKVKNHNTAYCVAVYQQKWFLPCFEFAGTKYHYKLDTHSVYSDFRHQQIHILSQITVV